jgi:predicted nuclease with TOPRIM domain
MTEPLNHKLDVSKIKTLKDVKNVFECMNLYASASEDNEKYELLKEYFTIPNEPQEIKFELPRKSLEEISQECEEKFDKHIESIKDKFTELKHYQEYQYNQKFNRIIKDFEYAKEHGKFPEKSRFIISNTLSANSKFTSTFVIKQGNKHEGYYTIGNGYLRFYMPYKPNAITRWFMNKCLSIRWVDEK